MSSKEIQDQFTQKVFLQLKSGSWELSLFPKVMRYLKYLRTYLGHKTEAPRRFTIELYQDKAAKTLRENTSSVLQVFARYSWTIVGK